MSRDINLGGLGAEPPIERGEGAALFPSVFSDLLALARNNTRGRIMRARGRITLGRIMRARGA